MTDPRAILRKAGLTPKRGFGQNFLVAESVVDAIATACVPEAERGRARVVELGAGTGALTSGLLRRAKSVVAVERDRDLVPLLRDAFAEAIGARTLTVLEADAQAILLDELFGPADPESPRVLAGNLPYQITGRLLQLAVDGASGVERVVFMVQAEVADRLLASAGTKEYGALTVFVRAAFDVARVIRVSPGSFHPSPEVASAVVVLTPRRPVRAKETESFRALVKAAFGMRRKTLRNAWRAVFSSPEALERVASSCGVSLDLRGETLEVEAFAAVGAAMDAEPSVVALRGATGSPRKGGRAR